MKSRSKTCYCKHCGDIVPREERLLTGGDICALCDHMRSEALHIHQAVSRDANGKARRRLV